MLPVCHSYVVTILSSAIITICFLIIELASASVMVLAFACASTCQLTSSLSCALKVAWNGASAALLSGTGIASSSYLETAALQYAGSIV